MPHPPSRPCVRYQRENGAGAMPGVVGDYSHPRLYAVAPGPSLQVCRQSDTGVTVYPFRRSVNG